MGRPKFGVATTKAYSTQLTAMYLLSLYIAQELSLIDDKKLAESISTLEALPENIEKKLLKTRRYSVYGITVL